PATSWPVAFAALAVPAAAAAALVLRARRSPVPPTIEKLLASGLTSTSSAISLVEARSGRLVFVDAAFERLTGHPAAEAVGSPWTLVEGPETDCETAARLRAAICESAICACACAITAADGRPYWSETFLSPVRDGDRP
ncbi:MAG TPA: PAS domain S-box protein, partial [Solirubrobacteraceae bacterium]|nr:PAS domain S-box protein [Solirubrobacteraceae bacterium]